MHGLKELQNVDLVPLRHVESSQTREDHLALAGGFLSMWGLFLLFTYLFTYLKLWEGGSG